MKRRPLLAGAAATGLVGLSGCLNGVLGTVTSLESTPAAVSQSALDSTGYEAAGIQDIVTEESVEVAGQSDTITVTSYLTEYEKAVGIATIAEPAIATFAVLSTPKLEVVGRTLNPVAEMSGREVADLIGDNYDSIAGIEADGTETVTILDQEVTKSLFVATASLAGVPLELDLHVTEAVERGSDLLVAIGVYPRLFRTVEGGNARELVESITAESPDPAAVNGSASGGSNETTDTTETEPTGNDSDSLFDSPGDSSGNDSLFDATGDSSGNDSDSLFGSGSDSSGNDSDSLFDATIQ